MRHGVSTQSWVLVHSTNMLSVKFDMCKLGVYLELCTFEVLGEILTLGEIRQHKWV